jgi:hypothetical protein
VAMLQSTLPLPLHKHPTLIPNDTANNRLPTPFYPPTFGASLVILTPFSRMEMGKMGDG